MYKHVEHTSKLRLSLELDHIDEAAELRRLSAARCTDTINIIMIVAII
jgi:hypothetical protein